MGIYPEVKEILKHNAAIKIFAERLNDKLDCDGVNWNDTALITGCKEIKGHLYKDGEQLDNGNGEEDYYVDQHAGYCEDSYNGTLYFKTDIPGEFICVSFDM
jgi:hypothetical protein